MAQRDTTRKHTAHVLVGCLLKLEIDDLNIHDI